MDHTGELGMISQIESTTRIYELTIRLDFGQIMAILFALILFGILYNMLVDFLDSRRYSEGYLSLLVAFGVFFTLAGIAFISWAIALIALLGFAASGLPMMVGSISRYMRKRAHEQALYRNVERYP